MFMQERFEREKRTMSLVISSASILLAVVIVSAILFLSLGASNIRIAFFRQTILGLTVCSFLFISSILEGLLFMEDPKAERFFLAWAVYCFGISLLVGSLISNLISFLMY